MTPYYADNLVTIYHGRCQDVCYDLGGDSANALITDPMFGVSAPNIKGLNKGRKTLNRDFFGAADHLGAAVNQVEAGLSCLTEACAAFIYCGHSQFGNVNDLLLFHHFKTGPFAWTKSNPAPSVRKAGWRSAIELAVWGVRGDAFNWADQAAALNFWHGPACGNGHPEKNGHPTQKPTGSMAQAVRQLSKPGQTVLDTSMGSGTTLVVAKLLGRKAIGIDVDESYCEIAANRLAQGVLFGSGAS